MTTSASSRPAGASSPGLTFGDYLIFAMLLGVLAAAVAPYLKTQWAEGPAKEILEGPGKGALSSHLEAKMALTQLDDLPFEIEQTRAPGLYLKAVEEWDALLSQPLAKPEDAAWVRAIDAKERAAAEAWLSQRGLAPADIPKLMESLQAISPRLSAQETARVELLSGEGVYAAREIRKETLRSLFSQLHQLGASDWGLLAAGMRNPDNPELR